MARRDLLFDSHYPMPWIVWKRTHQITVGSGQWSSTKLAHGLPFIPLLVGQWSTNANFSPSYDLGVLTPGGYSGGQPETACIVSADTSDILFNIDNNATTTRTFYFRLMAFADPTYTGEVAPVDYDSPFRFNTKYRYQKLYMQGLSTTNNVSHNLGYIPQARVWSKTNNTAAPIDATITTTTLSSYTSNIQSFYYHIYLDPME